MSFEGEHIWIIGASSGIGKALAGELSASGATLVLSARRENELQQLNKELGNRHLVYPLDVSNSEALKETALKLSEQIKQIDRIIFLAAIYNPTSISKLDLSATKQMVEVNLLGAIYTTTAVLPILEKQEKGQLALCSSIAASIGLPNGQPYSATKAAVTNFAESLYAEAPSHIDIKLISPGFVETPLTDKNSFQMPMIIKPDQAAAEIAKGLQKRTFEIHFPKRFTRIMKIIGALPYSLSLWLTGKI